MLPTPCFSSVTRPGCLTPYSPSWLQALKDRGPISGHKRGFCQHVCYVFSFKTAYMWQQGKRCHHLRTLCRDDLKKTFKGEAYADDGFICFCCNRVISIKFKRAHFFCSYLAYIFTHSCPSQPSADPD